MTRAILLSLAASLASAVPAAAQRITFADRGTGQAAALVDSITTSPHVVRAGSGPLVLPRDSTVTTSLLVLGRPTYLASKVRGDVVVVGGDLFLRPGADISGRAVAIGGTVAETALGHVGGTVQSLRDETFAVQRDAGATGYTLSARSLRVGGDTLSDSLRIFRLAGIRGLLIPRYDRVDGLSLPLGVQFNLARQQLLLQPTITYRSRLGVLDPAVSLRVGPEEGTRFEGRVARDTRSNDLWITSELINSLKTLAFGTDTRNYFRSDLAEGRMFLRTGGAERATLEPFAGARVERVSPISATGNVFSFTDRHDVEKTSRPNPAVERGTIGSALVGVLYQSLQDDPAAVTSRLFIEAEQAVTAPAGTSTFTQLTADGRLEFPTFGLQRLRFRGHAVATHGDSVPRARWAYLGGSRTLGVSDLLEYGGTALVFVESRYVIPVASVQLPVVGPPTLVLIHRIGGAGLHTVSPLQQEVGVGVSLGPIDLELITGASGQHHTEFGLGVSLPAF